MAMTSTANPATVADRLQTYFSKKLLTTVVETTVMDQFAQTQDLPANMGSKTMRFFRRRPARTDDIVSPTEGVAISTFGEVEVGYVEATLAQRGAATKISDVLQAIDAFGPLKMHISAMAEDAALDYDTIARNAIITGMANSNNGFERFAGLAAPTSAGGSTSSDRFTSLSAATAANSKLTRARALTCATQLMSNKVPRINGGYVAVVPPQIMHDIRQDTDWVTAATNVNNRALYKRETITLDGVTYVESTNPFIEDDTYGTYNATDASTPDDLIFSTLFLGAGAYGTPKLAGSTSPLRPQVFINDKPDKSDPANQFVVAAWKAFYTAKLLKTNLSYTKDGASVSDIPFCVLFRSKSTFASAA